MRLLSISVLCLVSGFASVVFAEACTYDEAILALRQGNQVRALALLGIAARDGDKRAGPVLAGLRKLQLTQQPKLQQAPAELAYSPPLFIATHSE